MKRFAIYFLLILLLFWRCAEKEPVKLAPEDFFPLKIGFYQVYDVEEIIYTAFNPPETITYELKSEIVDAFTNAGAETTYVIHRSIRHNDNASWQYRETWSARTDGQYAVVNEGNVSFVKLVFPLMLKSRWNGNLFNGLGEDEYVFESLEGKFSPAPGIEFETSVVVNQNDESNLVNRDQRIEVYAPGHGLVFKESKVWNYNCTGGSCTSQIIGGYYLKQTLKDYGQQ